MPEPHNITPQIILREIVHLINRRLGKSFQLQRIETGGKITFPVSTHQFYVDLELDKMDLAAPLSITAAEHIEPFANKLADMIKPYSKCYELPLPNNSNSHHYEVDGLSIRAIEVFSSDGAKELRVDVLVGD